MTLEKKSVGGLEKLKDIPPNTPGFDLIKSFIGPSCSLEEAILKAVESWKKKLEPLEKQRFDIDSQIEVFLTEGRQLTDSEADLLKLSKNKVKQTDTDYYELQGKINFWLSYSLYTK